MMCGPAGRSQGAAPRRPGARAVPWPLRVLVVALGLSALALLLSVVGAPVHLARAAAWSVFSNEQLGIAIDHPWDWKVDARADGAVFRSPQGDTIELKRMEMLPDEREQSTMRCTEGRRPAGGSVRVCWDPMSTTRTAYVSLGPVRTSRPWALVTTARRIDPGVFDRMVDSLRVRPGSRPR